VKPLRAVETSYAPGGISGIRYVPSASVVAVTLSRWRDGPLTVTVAPGSTPPLESRTVPAIDPVTCAKTCGAERQRTNIVRTSRRRHRDNMRPSQPGGEQLTVFYYLATMKSRTSSWDFELQTPRRFFGLDQAHAS
jgi:hypothetical protein